MTRLEQMREREKKATKGPWRACAWDPMERPHVTEELKHGMACHHSMDMPRTREDADFIAHARTDLSLLLAVAEAAKKVDEYSSFDFSAPKEFWNDLDTLRAALAPLLAEVTEVDEMRRGGHWLVPPDPSPEG